MGSPGGGTIAIVPAAKSPASAGPKRPSVETEILVCRRPEQPDAPTFSLEIVNDIVGVPQEIRVTGSFDVHRYKVTKVTGATYAAEETEPTAPDAVGMLFLDRIGGRLIQKNYISFAAVAVLVRFCDGLIDRPGLH